MSSAASTLAANLTCAHCEMPLAASTWNRPGAFCPYCHAAIQVLAFPALLAGLDPARATQALDGEATCFFHDSKKADVACDRCGRLLCGLCQFDFNGATWCPNCIGDGLRKKELVNLDTSRNLYDNWALTLATLPLLLWPFTIVGAPVALFVAIRYWRAPSSLVRRTRIRLYIAIVLAVLQIAGWAWLLIFLVSRI